MHFVITHKPLEWEIPFQHQLISVGESTVPGSIHASRYLHLDLALDHSLGGSRSNLAIYEIVRTTCEMDESVAVSSYRMFLSTDIEDSGFTPIAFDNRFTVVSADHFVSHHEEIVLQKLPIGLDLIIARPIQFNVSILEQYTAHHLQDLLKGVAMAIEMQLIDQSYAAYMLSRPTLLPFGYYLSSAKLRIEFHERFWDFMIQYYLTYGRNLARNGFQRRYIDFVAERVHAIFLFEQITKRNLKFRTSRPILVSDSGYHVPSK